MYGTKGVLALLTLYMGLVHSFSWDIVMLNGQELEFYNYGKLIHSEHIDYVIYRIVYDPVHNSVLLAHQNQSNPDIAVSSFDIATKKIEPIVRPTADVKGLAFDPLTETIFWIENTGGYSIYSFSIKPGSNNKNKRNLLITSGEKLLEYSYIAVDSCGGYIYWMACDKIEKARLDGSERKVVINLDTKYEHRGLAIDQQKLKVYWVEIVCKRSRCENSIKSADLNGQNITTLYTHKSNDDQVIAKLSVSKDFIYWGDETDRTYWQFPKILPHDRHVIPKQSFAGEKCVNCDIDAKYKAQTKQSCEAVKSLPQTVPSDYKPYYYYLEDPTNVSLRCVHGTKVSGESRCECTQGYTGERCDVPVCYNYCLQGNCSVSAEGHPKCRCKAGYFGERCQFNACHGYCLENGVCSLNEKNERICQCTEDFEGERCDVPVFLVKCFQTVSMLRDILKTDLTQVNLGKGVKMQCAPTTI